MSNISATHHRINRIHHNISELMLKLVVNTNQLTESNQICTFSFTGTKVMANMFRIICIKCPVTKFLYETMWHLHYTVDLVFMDSMFG
jgi:hypothetical protein